MTASEPDTLRERVRDVIFEADTPLGKGFDVVLIVAILASVLLVLLDSVAWMNSRYGEVFYLLEWTFTILFTIEYLVRLWCIDQPKLYAKSFYGIVDLLGILPTYLSLLVAGTQYLLVVRILRVLRVFRILRLTRYMSEASLLMEAMRSSRRKITVFLFTVMTVVVIAGSFMYLIEGPSRGFTSIPRAMYWSIVTLTTVGYGDISPQTPVGQALAAVIMVLGYGIIAVPTGIVTLELNQAMLRRAEQTDSRACQACAAEGHRRNADYCYRCGTELLAADPQKAS